MSLLILTRRFTSGAFSRLKIDFSPRSQAKTDLARKTTIESLHTLSSHRPHALPLRKYNARLKGVRICLRAGGGGASHPAYIDLNKATWKIVKATL